MCFCGTQNENVPFGSGIRIIILVGLQNHYSDYFWQLKRLCQRLYTTIGSGLCFFENHLEISTPQASLLLVQGETDFQSLVLKVGILCC